MKGSVEYWMYWRIALSTGISVYHCSIHVTGIYHVPVPGVHIRKIAVKSSLPDDCCQASPRYVMSVPARSMSNDPSTY